MGKVFDVIWQIKRLRTARVRELLRCYEEIPGISKWVPARHDWRRVLFWAYVLELAGNEPSMRELVDIFAISLQANSKPNPDAFSELSAAALLKALGWTVDKIPRTHERTPDLLVKRGGTEFELEVTNANPKKVHEDLKLYGGQVLDLIRDPGRGHDIVVMLASVLTSAEEGRLKEAVAALSPGRVEETVGLWRVVAEPFGHRTAQQLAFRRFEDLPQWWPARKGDPSRAAFLAIAGTSTFAPDQPSTVVACDLPVTKSYLGPLQRKAGRSQGSQRRPLLVAIDVENLPGAHEELDCKLPRRFPQWRHLSGVLAFQPFWEGNRVGWCFRYFANDRARMRAEGAGTDPGHLMVVTTSLE